MATRARVQRLFRVAADEFAPLLTRRVLADVAAALPGSALCNTRTALFRAAGVTIGPKSLIQGTMRITGADNGSLITIGHHTLITGGLHIDLGAPVHIGDGVRIGHDVSIFTVSHAVGAPNLRAGTSFCAEVRIENGVWIASRASILPGVTIGAGSIVAAGSVVTRSVPPHCMVGGVPARLIRPLPESSDFQETIPDSAWAVRH